MKFILIGLGSNLVVSDEPLDCYVVRFCTNEPIIALEGLEITVSGSTELDKLALFAAENGLEGINFAAGIPGTVGGAIAGNAGAWGKQIGDALVSAELISPEGIRKTARNNDLNFAYRDSILKETSEIVLWAKFRFKKSDVRRLLKEREEILLSRREKHPDLKIAPCAGSFFRNIEPTSKADRRQAAGWFLEQAGGKNLKIGGAVVYPKHANIIIKTDNCRAQDVYDLSVKMARLVKDKFNIELIREVRFVGRFNGMPAGVNTIIW